MRTRARPTWPRPHEQGSEVRRIAEDAACRVHPVQLGGKSRARKTTVQTVLNDPGRGFVIQVESVSAPGMTDEVMDGTKTIECAAEFTIQQRMQAPLGVGSRADFQSRVCAYRRDEFLVACVRLGTPGEHHSYRAATGVPGEEGKELIRFLLELPVRLNDPGIAMRAPRA